MSSGMPRIGHSAQHTCHLTTLRELAEAGAVREVQLVAEGSRWYVLIRSGMHDRVLLAERGHRREFSTVEVAIRLLRSVGLARVLVDSAQLCD